MPLFRAITAHYRHLFDLARLLIGQDSGNRDRNVNRNRYSAIRVLSIFGGNGLCPYLDTTEGNPSLSALSTDITTVWDSWII